MLSFGLDAGFESFPPLVNGLVHNRLFQVSPDINKSALVAMETVQLVLSPYQTFQAQWIRNWMSVHCVRNHFRRTYFDKFMPTCLRGPVFYETQCSFWRTDQWANNSNALQLAPSNVVGVLRDYAYVRTKQWLVGSPCLPNGQFVQN